MKVDIKNEDFLKNLAKQYVQETGEQYLLENDELEKSLTNRMDAKIRARLNRNKRVYISIAASIIVLLIASLAFLPEVLRESEYAAETQMAPVTTPAPGVGEPAPTLPAPMAPPMAGIGPPPTEIAMPDTVVGAPAIPPSDMYGGQNMDNVWVTEEAELVQESQFGAMRGTGTISVYLPITLHDQFRLTAIWTYPDEKTDFTQEELMIINDVISSLSFHGYDTPWGDYILFGMLPILYATSEEHETVLYLHSHQTMGTFMFVTVNDEPGRWFTVDRNAFHELIELVR